MYSIEKLEKTESQAGHEKWTFTVRFYLSGEQESVRVHGWRYYPGQHRLYKPSFGNSHANLATIDDNLALAIKDTVSRFILFYHQSYEIQTAVLRARKILEIHPDPLDAYNSVKAEFTDTKLGNLSPNQYAILVGLAIMADQHHKGKVLNIELDDTEFTGGV